MGLKKSKIPPEILSNLRNCTLFNDKELSGWYKEFKRGCPSGRMSKKEFEDIYNSFYNNNQDASEFASHIFRTFDANGDNYIDFTEFMIGLSITGRGSYEDKLRWTFNMYDVDKSGSVTQDELVDIIRSIQCIMGKSEETPEELAQTLFGQIDTDGDGAINVDEFIAGAQNNERLIKLLQQK